MSEEKIAIIGYSCILPGGENVCESWETIKVGVASNYFAFYFAF